MPVLLDVKNLLISQLLTDYYILAKESYTNVPIISPISHTFCDFDQVQYKLDANAIQDDASSLHISLSISAPCIEKLNTLYSIETELRQFYPSLIDLSLGSNLILSLKFKLSFENDAFAYDLIDQLSLLKRNLFSIPFFHAISIQESGTENNQVVMFDYRPDESVFIKPYPDRVVVIFQLQFKDQADTIFAKVFTQEFVDARKLPHLQNSPQVIFSKDPPSELDTLYLKSAISSGSDQNGYLSIVLFPRHYSSGERRENTVSRIQTFRNYFHYHIKALKAALHTRQRARVCQFLQVLNRAKPEPVQKKLTTFKGKTFH